MLFGAKNKRIFEDNPKAVVTKDDLAPMYSSFGTTLYDPRINTNGRNTIISKTKTSFHTVKE